MTPPDTPAGRLITVEAAARALEKQVDRLAHQVDAFGPIGGQIIEAASDVEAVRESQAEIRQLIRDTEDRITRGIADVSKTCKEMNEARKNEAAAIRREFVEDANRRSEMRGKIVVAVIGASAIVLAAIITAIVAILFA